MGNSRKEFWLVLLSIVLIIMAPVVYWTVKGQYDYMPQVERALSKENFRKANSIVNKMADIAETKVNVNCTWDDYRDAYYLTLNSEVNYLLNDISEMSINRLVVLLQSLKMGEYPVTGLVGEKKIQADNDRYNASVSRHHSIMDGIISRAIAMNNQYLAESIVQCYRPILVRTTASSHLFKANEYYYEYSDEPKQKAQRVVNEAFAKGN